MRAHQQYEDDTSVEERGGWGGLYPSHSPPIVKLESNDKLFLHLRLLMQLLCNHYTSMHEGKLTGMISLDADASGLINDALTKAKHVCDANVGVAPEVVIPPDNDVDEEGRRGGGGSDSNNFWLLLIIRPWLHHAIVEVTKNAMILNVMRWQRSPSSETLDTMQPGCAYQFRDVVRGYGGRFVGVIIGGGG
jgi:hypothetical protein